jgi:DNA-binding NarL/FixJ family response regulator
VIREGLELVLAAGPDLEVVAAVADGEQAVAAVAEHQPDAILLDLHMPVLDGLGATERLTREHPHVAIVLLTTYADDETIIAALKAGARGYLTKNADRREIAQALHGAAAGHTILPPDVTAMLLAGSTAQRPRAPLPTELPDDLTVREAEILKLLAAGLSNKEIASELFISAHTVKTHINHVFAKTKSRDRPQAIRYAHEHGLSD